LILHIKCNNLIKNFSNSYNISRHLDSHDKCRSQNSGTSLLWWWIMKIVPHACLILIPRLTNSGDIRQHTLGFYYSDRKANDKSHLPQILKSTCYLPSVGFHITDRSACTRSFSYCQSYADNPLALCSHYITHKNTPTQTLKYAFP
jgi:hypothetical protein